MDLNLNTTNRFKLITELGGKCRICLHEQIEHLEVDHIYNDGAEERAKYGTGEKIWGFYLNNIELAFRRLQPLCKECHSSKTWVRKDDDNTYINTKLEVQRIFMEAIKKLEGEQRKPIHRDVLIAELGVDDNAEWQYKWNNVIRRMLREASIYESQPDCFNSV